MTLSEIINSALAQFDRSADPQLVSKYANRFTQYANDAILDIAKDFPLHMTESVALVDGKFYTTDLTKFAIKILRITQDDVSVAWDIGDETSEITCKNSAGDDLTGSVSVTYKYAPTPLQNVSDRPAVPAPLHPCIVTYVVAREKASGDPTTQGSANVFFQLYNEQKRNLMNGGYGAPSTYQFKNR